MIKLDRRIFSHFDWAQPILILPIVAISYLLVQEASPRLADKQLIYVLVGLCAFFIIFAFPLRRFAWLIPTLYWVNIILLLSTDFFGVKRLGAKRWLEVPWTDFTIQPSELFKPAFILMLSYLIYRNPPPLGGYRLKDFLKLSFYILLPFLLIASEPDLGTATVLLFVGFGTLFIVGVHYKVWLGIILVVGISSPIIYNYGLRDYQKARIMNFINDEQGHQVRQSIIAIGNGGLLGKSSEEATQTRFKFLPIATSDFIFAYTIERFGFVGGALVLLLYALLILHLLSLNQKLRGDYFALVAINCVALFIFVYVSVNVLMNIGFAPVVGIPMPFYSNGGSSFTTFMVFFGIIQNLITFRYFAVEKAIKIS